MMKQMGNFNTDDPYPVSGTRLVDLGLQNYFENQNQ